MTHSLIAPERTDEAIFVSRVLADERIAPQIDGVYGPDIRLQALEKAVPLAGHVIEAATPGATEAMRNLSRQYVRHEALIDDNLPADATLHGDGLILMSEPPLPGADDTKAVERSFSPLESEVVFDAVKKTALHPPFKGDDLVALDFLARHSDEVDGAVSQFILDKTKDHPKARFLLTGILLRLF